MAYYNICPDCGATLDPGESCDCQNNDTGQEEKIKKEEEHEKED